MIRVFAKKAFKFNRHEKKDGQMVVAETATTIPFNFCNLPDWVQNDQMFKWAKADGDIEIMQNKEDEKVAELNAAVKPGPKKEKLLKN